MIDIEKLDQPYLQVVWEDVPENFSQEKIKRVKSYFQQKYKSKHVTVKTVPVVDKTLDAKLRTLEVSDSILDPQYQKKLVKEYMEQNNITTPWDLINRLDDKVNAEVSKDSVNTIRYNKWILKRIEFSNFLSYGQDNIIDFTKLPGITIVESNPVNFGGKTVAVFDSILFLLFNTTSKTKTQDEVFNKFTDENEVLVKGYLEIDNQDYIIERKITRKQKKNGEWDAKTDLTFYKKVNDKYENLSGEQRRETEAYIQSAIGDKEDFLITIMTTLNNLEDLLEAKATARGQLLTKFLGLETFRKKEEACKTMYSDWSKKLVSNLYNVTTLEEEILKYETKIEEHQNKVTEYQSSLELNKKELDILNSEKELLLRKQHTDIDADLARINPSLFKKEIELAEEKLSETQRKFDELEVKEPTSYYKTEEHIAVQNEVNTIKVDYQVGVSEGTKISQHLSDLKEGAICPTCKRVIDNENHDDEIKALEAKIEEKRVEVAGIQSMLKEKEKELLKYGQLKKEFEDYDRNKLIKEKYGIEIQQKEFGLKEKKDKLHQWEKNKSKLEENLATEKEMVRVRTSIDTKKTEWEIWKDSIKDLQNQIHQCEVNIKNNTENIGKIKKEDDIRKVFQTYLSIYGKNGITKSIMKNMVPLINQELGRILSDSCQFSLNIDINDKNEVEFMMIDNETRVEKAMSAGSGYEKTIASLALRAVLAKISTLPKPNINVMDEIFGKVADENLDMVGEFFNKIKKYFETIIIITHKPEVKNWADNVISVRKENNISTLLI